MRNKFLNNPDKITCIIVYKQQDYLEIILGNRERAATKNAKQNS